ncbi:DUF3784 domain-containing protein [Amphibacillus sp. Q70]|uniref:DUF3784 domain-containing protein n=1 Tax=Amphibacillus sp. Q70 TaxID=3453416 RepID=UPI003F86DD65
MFDLLLMSVMGLLCLIVGLLIWKRDKITLIHSYHYTNVTKENQKAYTEKMGKALIVMSIGMFLTGIVNYITNTAYGWLCFAIFFVAGLMLILKAQKNIMVDCSNFQQKNILNQ